MTITALSHLALNTADLDRFRRFYEGILDIPVSVVRRMDHPPYLRHALFHVPGGLVLHVREVPGYDPSLQGIGRSFGERGRIDHFGFQVDDETALRKVAGRLRAAGASDGEIGARGPLLSALVHDPDGLELEINCPNLAFDVRAGDVVEELVRPDLLDQVAGVTGSAA